MQEDNISAKMGEVEPILQIQRKSPTDKVIALAGNPNVGKSTVFNALTGMKQHTGNWAGKTVSNAQGYCQSGDNTYVLVDIPGTYSLMAHSVEEQVARNFVCFGECDLVVVVCDACCLERNLNLVLQTMEAGKKVLVCVNLMDEAKRKNIKLNLDEISKRLGVKVVGVVGRKKKSLKVLLDSIDEVFADSEEATTSTIDYGENIESVIKSLESTVQKALDATANTKINARWLSIKLLGQDKTLMQELAKYLGAEFMQDQNLQEQIVASFETLAEQGITQTKLEDILVGAVIEKAENICTGTVTYESSDYNAFDRKLDKVLTQKSTGYPVMIILLLLVFWITITGANYPSGLIADGLFWLQDKISDVFYFCGSPEWLHGVLVLGVYRVLAWVVSVMLPPMAIFFPLFTLLEDAGYLPRIAYNLDKPFKCCKACGKQALTMCMGFGCNAAGIIGCRIIDSKRERLLAILTNNFVPCNGRFPTIIAILTMFFVGVSAQETALNSFWCAVMLTGVILLGVGMTFLSTKILSSTLLKGEESSFTLEMPPYRKPQIGKVIVRSIFDRTLFVLMRAIIVAAPAGLVIWVMANITVGNFSVLDHCAAFLDPFASLMGLDGVILIAFILGFPANEIVIPIVIMAYMSQGSILELDSLAQMRDLFVANGWTFVTAISTILFSLMHWPCSTTLLTIKKETGSIKWCVVAFILPTIFGIVACMTFNFVANLFI